MAVVLCLLLLLPAAQAWTAFQRGAGLTSPRQQFGVNIGDDYFLATYSQLEEYWQTLAAESDRMTLVDIGRTEEGRTQWMAVVSAPENLQKLERHREISQRLAIAEGLNDDAARVLAAEGRAVVWIDGGLHANEVLGAQQLIATVYDLVSRSDPETLRILRDVILLAVHANPDGHELVAGWYMRERDPRRRTLSGVPRAYQKYVGHDNNRDFYMGTQAETRNMNRVLYRDWLPQIVYNHHQTSPPGTVMFAPPFRGPFNYVLDPLVPASIDLIGSAMHARFAAEGKAGVTMRGGGAYSTWWNGGLRTTPYFHNQIGLLSETFGSPTPTDIPFVPERQVPSADLPFPIAPQRWHFRQSIDYALTANRAVLDVASRYREAFLFNIYRMGSNAIRRGSEDTWTVTPRHMAALGAEVGPRQTAPAHLYAAYLRDPALRDPRGYILPADQPDFATATKFVQALQQAGVIVHRAPGAFTVGGREYPPDSYVVKTAQAFRPHVLDMFEPQDHPDDIPYDGGTPVPPYDSAGWTLAYQMGVKFERVLDAFEGPFERIDDASVPPGAVTGPAAPAGYLVNHHPNDAAIVVNRLLAAGDEVYWLRDRTAGGAPAGTGAIYIAPGTSTRPRLEQAARELGLTVTGVADVPHGDAWRVRPVRIGLWDRYGGSPSSGWARWVLERFEFPFEVIYAPQIDRGDLARRYDVLIFTSDAVPVYEGRRIEDGTAPSVNVPDEYRHTIGSLTWNRSIPALRQFVQDGGVVLAIGGATIMGEHLGARVSNALADRDGITGTLPRERFFVPGSVLRVAVDNTTPLAFGFEPRVDVFFDDSPVFRIGRDASSRSLRRVAWFAEPSPLRSGWAWGQQYLQDGIVAIDAPVGPGRVLLFGPDILFRAQSHGTFRFLFNGIYYAKAEATRLSGGR